MLAWRITYSDPRLIVMAAYHFVRLTMFNLRRMKIGATAMTKSVTAEMLPRLYADTT